MKLLEVQKGTTKIKDQNKIWVNIRNQNEVDQE